MDDSFTGEPDYETYNSTWILEDLKSNLKYAKEEDGPVEEGRVSYSLGDSLNMRLVIHYAGDIHQPLHAMSRYTNELPDGDAGGNKFYLTKKDGISELHALWDSVIYEYDDDLSQPLSETDWDYLGN